MKALMSILRKEAIARVTCWELKSQLFKVLVLSTFTYGTEIWGGDLKHPHWKVFKKGMKMHMMYHVKVRSLTTYHILPVKFGETRRIICSQAHRGLSATACPPIPLLAS